MFRFTAHVQTESQSSQESDGSLGSQQIGDSESMRSLVDVSLAELSLRSSPSQDMPSSSSSTSSPSPSRTALRDLTNETPSKQPRRGPKRILEVNETVTCPSCQHSIVRRVTVHNGVSHFVCNCQHISKCADCPECQDTAAVPCPCRHGVRCFHTP